VLRYLRSSNRIEAALAWGCVLVLLIQCAFIAHRRAARPSDFDVAREFGRRFVAREYLYRSNLHFPYLPAAAMVLAPLSFVPAHLGFALHYGAALLCLWYTLAALFGMVAPRYPAIAGRGFAVASAAVVLAGQYILRDLGNAGPHLLLMALALLATRLVGRGRPLLAAPAYGLLMVVKPPFALLLAFFAWKRLGRLFAAASLALVLWALAPMIHMGAGAWWEHHTAWARAAFPFLPSFEHSAPVQTPTAAAAAPITAAAILEWNKNQALYAALLRNLPPTPIAPRFAAALLLLALLGLAARSMRRRYRGADDPRWLVESAAVFLLAVLLSPIAWVQHFVFAVPALYLIVAERPATRSVRFARLALLGAYAVAALVLNPEVAGHERSFRLLGRGLHTFAALLLLGWLLVRSPTATPNVPRDPARGT
jgi:hypothetical protein